MEDLRLDLSNQRIGFEPQQNTKAEPTDGANPRPFGTSGMSPAHSAARAGAMPEASGDSSSGTFGKETMIYASLSVFGMFGAYVTAESERTFKRVFRDVVYDSLRQYADEFGQVAESFKERIKTDMDAFILEPITEIEGLFYDLRVDGNGYKGIISVDEIFTSKKEAELRYREVIEDLNKDLDASDEPWAVFGGGFFPAEEGFEIDELFK